MSGHNALHDNFRAPHEIIDPGDAGSIIPDRTPGVCPIVSGGAETRSLPDPRKAGLRLTLAMRTDGGNCVVTASTAANQAGNNTLTFDDAGDTIELVSIALGSGFVWRITSNDGVGLSTV